MPGTEAAILEDFQAFVGFVRERVGDPHHAEDIVQDSLPGLHLRGTKRENR
ncbi:MAG TPA: hypothetical protein VJA21_31010 [Verrucomicrobiae bacterium]